MASSDSQGVIFDARRFLLDEDVLPGTEFRGPIPYLNTGRQVTCNRQGRWVCGLTLDRRQRDRNWLVLAVSDDACSQGSAFPDPILLVGREGTGALFASVGDRISNACVLLDSADLLHVVYEGGDGLYLLTADASGESPRQKLSKKESWSGPVRLGEAGSLLGDALVDGAGRWVVYFTREDRLYERVPGEAERVVCDRATHPTVYLDAAGTTHLTFERDRRIFYLRRSAGSGAWTDAKGNPGPEMVAHFCSSFPSVAATTDGKVIIAYQGEGKADLKRYPPFYRPMRGAGGTTVSYVVHDGSGWSLHDLLRSSEILLKRRPHHRNPQKEATFLPFMEEFWRPSLTVDHHGVIWMFYANTTRRHVFWSRFQGETFGTHHEARGPYDVMARTVFLQKETRGQKEIGYLTVASNQVYFDAISVPDYRSSEARRVVFLDNLEVDRLVNLEHVVGTWQKHPEPLFGWGISGQDLDDNIAWCHVYRREDGFEMRYMSNGTKWRTNGMPGRAFSRDGIHWEKREPVSEAHLTLDGKPLPSNFWRPIYLEDPEERDPARRLKGLIARYRFERGVEYRVWDVIVSPDGSAWRTVPGLPTVVSGDISICTHLIRDEEDPDPARRYKFMGLSGCSSGRGAVMFTSPDLIHWGRAVYLREDPDDLLSPVCPYPTGPIVIDPDAGESPWEEEVHDGYAWREHGILMFHYDAFYFGQNQHIEKALAVSRDGRHYWRVKRGAINMPHGPCGAWDSGRDRTSVPIRVGDELWMYFCGMPAQYFGDADAEDYAPQMYVDAWGWDWQKQRIRQEQRPWRVGMARLRADGWAYLQLNRNAETGYLTTIPFDYTGGGLVINGTGLGSGGIRVEVLTADGASVIPGFGRDHCRFSAPDAVTSRVTWDEGKALPPGRYRLRFVFEGLRARLYAFGFEP